MAIGNERGGSGLAVRIDGVRHAFPGREEPLLALDGLDLAVPADSFTAVIGPNGCGKSTLLRLVAGLLRPERGSVSIGDGATAAAPQPGDGRVGLAFQQPRLVPWLTAHDNVALPLAMAGVDPRERASRAALALQRVGLEAAAGLRPGQLSGGMAQRAGLARALIGDPPVLLLDEPFSALDALTREAFDAELERLWMEQPRTTVLVTHSVTEAIRLADRIVVMTARPGAVALLVEVNLPRPRPVQPADPAAAAIDAAVREALARVHPPELAPWTGPRAVMA
ncbi:MAG TPA: ABC transporter ATP-binding protein [Candidatus Limnocylindrales bacterium]|nr:ABC transporter ATP-binding protein [Candidatus Limnocylindrales bacterium]